MSDMTCKSPTKPEVPGPFPVGTRVKANNGRIGKVVGYGFVDGHRKILFDGEIEPRYAFIEGLTVEPAKPEPSKPDPSPSAHRWATGDRVRLIPPHDDAGQSGEIVAVNRWPFEWYYVLTDGGRLVLADRGCLAVVRGDTGSGSAKPEPATQPWAAGDEAILNHTLNGRQYDVVLVRKSESFPNDWFVDCNKEWFSAVVHESRLTRPPGWKPNPSPQPTGTAKPTDATPPATILYRVEYPEADNGPIYFNLDPPPARKAALIPVAGVAERLRWSEVLEILSEYSNPDKGPTDEFAVAQLGGRMVEPYAEGDKIVVTHGSAKGHTFYLVRRDEANDQHWWMTDIPGEYPHVGLHVDRFELAKGGDR